MSVDFGTDIDCVTSIGPRFKLTSGYLNLAKALARRLITPRGTLDYAPDYGYDVRDWLSHDTGQASKFTLQNAIDTECQKDERVRSVSSTVDTSVRDLLSITLAVDTADGPFKFVTTIDKLNGILSVSLA